MNHAEECARHAPQALDPEVPRLEGSGQQAGSQASPGAVSQAVGAQALSPGAPSTFHVTPSENVPTTRMRRVLDSRILPGGAADLRYWW